MFCELIFFNWIWGRCGCCFFRHVFLPHLGSWASSQRPLCCPLGPQAPPRPLLLGAFPLPGSVFPAVCLSCSYVHPAKSSFLTLEFPLSLSSWCVFSCEFLNTSVMVALKSLCSDSILCIILGLFLLTNFLPGYGHIFLLLHMSNDFLFSARHHKFSACLDLVVFL